MQPAKSVERLHYVQSQHPQVEDFGAGSPQGLHQAGAGDCDDDQAHNFDNYGNGELPCILHAAAGMRDLDDATCTLKIAAGLHYPLARYGVGCHW